jgi:hypothetical protein
MSNVQELLDWAELEQGFMAFITCNESLNSCTQNSSESIELGLNFNL